jgi:hypothetical protein
MVEVSTRTPIFDTARELLRLVRLAGMESIRGVACPGGFARVFWAASAGNRE